MEHYKPLSFDRPLHCYECYICYLILPLHCLHILRNNHLLYKCSYGKMNLKLITIAKIDQLHTFLLNYALQFDVENQITQFVEAYNQTCTHN